MQTIGELTDSKRRQSTFTCVCLVAVWSVARSVARIPVTARSRSRSSQEVRQGKEKPNLLAAGFSCLLLAPGLLLQGGSARG